MNRNFNTIYNYVYEFCFRNKLKCSRSYDAIRMAMDINVEGYGRRVCFPVSENNIIGASYVRLVAIADNITDWIREAFLDNNKKRDDRADAMRYASTFITTKNPYMDVNSMYPKLRSAYADSPYLPRINNVIFNDPATIVFWSDGSKTVVKATDEAFDPEKGLAMAITKKIYGNHYNYYNQIKKWLP